MRFKFWTGDDGNDYVRVTDEENEITGIFLINEYAKYELVEMYENGTEVEPRYYALNSDWIIEMQDRIDDQIHSVLRFKK